MIKLQIIGNLGKDALVNNVNGKTVINFTVAHTEKYKDSQGNSQEKTTWVDCAYWTDRTAVAPYLTKGTSVYAEGTPEIRSFTRQDGTNGSSLTMRVREVQLLGGNKTTGGQSGQVGQGSQERTGYQSNGNGSPAPVSSGSDMNDQMDDLPF